MRINNFISRTPANSFRTGRQGNRPLAIVLHTTGHSTRSAINTVSNAGNTVSYHYIIAGDDTNAPQNHKHFDNIADGFIVQMVADENTAHHAGRGFTPDNNRTHGTPLKAIISGNIPRNPNLYTIGIAFGDMNWNNSMPTAKQIEAAAQLIDSLCTRFNIPKDLDHIIGHIHIAPTWRPNCPGRNFPYTQLITPPKKEEQEMQEIKRFNTVEELPNWAMPTIQKLIEKNALHGTGMGLNLTEDMLRIFVIHDRMGLYD